MVKKCEGNTKRLLKIPSKFFKEQEVSRLYPFLMALKHNNDAMFKYFWEEISYVYCTETTFESLFRVLAKKQKHHDLISYLLSSKPMVTLFLSMSYSYRHEFIEHILKLKNVILKELDDAVI